MFFNSFGERVPYTNYHDLNLDWILKVMKDFNIKYNNIDTTITEGKETLDNTISQGLTDIQIAKSQAINQMNNIAENYSKRYIILGDSYGNRTNGNGQNYYQLLIALGVITSENSYFNNVAGAAFIHPEPDHTFKYLLESLNVDNPETVTDIIIECGANDNFHEFSPLITAMVEFYTYAHLHFPLAKIQLFACGLTMTPDAIIAREDATLQAFRESSSFGFVFIPNSECVLYNTTYMESDRCHPNASGVTQITWGLAQAIRSGYCDTRHKIWTSQTNATAAVTGDITPSGANIGEESIPLVFYSNNNIMKCGMTSGVITLSFNLNGIELTPDNRIIITFDNITGLPTVSEIRYCTLARNADTDAESYSKIATVEYGYNSNSNKYTLTIRPMETFNSGEDNNVIQIWLSDTVIM